jgi:hypothetical protein
LCHDSSSNTSGWGLLQWMSSDARWPGCSSARKGTPYTANDSAHEEGKASSGYRFARDDDGEVSPSRPPQKSELGCFACFLSKKRTPPSQQSRG